MRAPRLLDWMVVSGLVLGAGCASGRWFEPPEPTVFTPEEIALADACPLMMGKRGIGSAGGGPFKRCPEAFTSVRRR